MKIKINDNNGLILKTQNKVCKEDIEIIVDENLGSGITPTGTINITSNGIVDVTHYANANVQVPSTGITPSGTYYATSNGTYDVTTYASVNVNVPSSIPEGYVKPSGTLSITSNGTYNVKEKESVNVNVQGLPQANDMLQAKVDAINSCDYLFYRYSGKNINFIANLNTSQAYSGKSMFEFCSNLLSVPTFDSSNFADISYMFHNDSKLVKIKLNTDSANNWYSTFDSCYRLKLIDISKFYSDDTRESSYAFRFCYSLMALVIRELGTDYIISNDIFQGSHHMLGTTNATYNPDGLHDGYVYVPRAMIEVLSNETNWSTVQFRALEDYTVDGTTTGELDLVRMGIYNSGESND